MSLLELFKTFTRGQENAQDQLNANFAALEGAFIVDSGSDVNGNWIKFANGTMICYYRENTPIDRFTMRTDTIQGLTIRHCSREYTYPQTFVGIPTIINAGDANGFGGLEALGAYSIQNNKATIYCECLTQPTSILSNIVIFGRWK